MSLDVRFHLAEQRYVESYRALQNVIVALEASALEMEQRLATALRKAPERVAFVNLPHPSGIGFEALHHPIASFDARNWPKGAEVADLIVELTDARRNYERAHSSLPVSERPPMKEPDDLIETRS